MAPVRFDQARSSHGTRYKRDGWGERYPTLQHDHRHGFWYLIDQALPCLLLPGIIIQSGERGGIWPTSGCRIRYNPATYI